jgi:hypothetical protein
VGDYSELGRLAQDLPRLQKRLRWISQPACSPHHHHSPLEMAGTFCHAGAGMTAMNSSSRSTNAARKTNFTIA